MEGNPKVSTTNMSLKPTVTVAPLGVLGSTPNTQWKSILQSDTKSVDGGMLNAEQLENLFDKVTAEIKSKDQLEIQYKEIMENQFSDDTKKCFKSVTDNEDNKKAIFKAFTRANTLSDTLDEETHIPVRAVLLATDPTVSEFIPIRLDNGKHAIAVMMRVGPSGCVSCAKATEQWGKAGGGTHAVMTKLSWYFDKSDGPDYHVSSRGKMMKTPTYYIFSHEYLEDGLDLQQAARILKKKEVSKRLMQYERDYKKRRKEKADDDIDEEEEDAGFPFDSDDDEDELPAPTKQPDNKKQPARAGRQSLASDDDIELPDMKQPATKKKKQREEGQGGETPQPVLKADLNGRDVTVSITFSDLTKPPTKQPPTARAGRQSTAKKPKTLDSDDDFELPRATKKKKQPPTKRPPTKRPRPKYTFDFDDNFEGDNKK